MDTINKYLKEKTPIVKIAKNEKVLGGSQKDINPKRVLKKKSFLAKLFK